MLSRLLSCNSLPGFVAEGQVDREEQVTKRLDREGDVRQDEQECSSRMWWSGCLSNWSLSLCKWLAMWTRSFLRVLPEQCGEKEVKEGSTSYWTCSTVQKRWLWCIFSFVIAWFLPTFSMLSLTLKLWNLQIIIYHAHVMVKSKTVCKTNTKLDS